MVLKTVEAIYDGKVFKPLEELELPPQGNYRFTITVEDVVDELPAEELPEKGLSPEKLEAIVQMLKEAGLGRDTDDEQEEVKGLNVLDVFKEFAGIAEGPGDGAAEHDHYLYGTPKKYSGVKDAS